jgi:hypothetical protein
MANSQSIRSSFHDLYCIILVKFTIELLFFVFKNILFANLKIKLLNCDLFLDFWS